MGARLGWLASQQRVMQLKLALKLALYINIGPTSSLSSWQTITGNVKHCKTMWDFIGYTVHRLKAPLISGLPSPNVIYSSAYGHLDFIKST